MNIIVYFQYSIDRMERRLHGTYTKEQTSKGNYYTWLDLPTELTKARSRESLNLEVENRAISAHDLKYWIL